MVCLRSLNLLWMGLYDAGAGDGKTVVVAWSWWSKGWNWEVFQVFRKVVLREQSFERKVQ